MLHQLEAGIAETEITGSTGMNLAGDLGTRPCAGVASPLRACALSLRSGEETALILALDLMGLEAETAEALSGRIASACGLPAERILLCCSHVRSAPCTVPVPGAEAMEQGYLRSLGPTLEGLAAKALADPKQASLGVGRALLPHLVFNHRLVTRNYKTVSAWLPVPPNEVLCPEGPADPEFLLLVLRGAAGEPLAVLWNLAADIRFPLPPEEMSGGLPEAVQREVDRRLGSHLPCLYLPGCGGNVSYSRDFSRSVDELSSAVIAVCLETSCDPDIRLAVAQENAVVPIRDYSQLWNRAEIELKAPELLPVFEAEILRMQEQGAQAVPASIRVLRLGRFALVGLPGLPFAELGRSIKKASPFQRTIVTANVGPYLGYLATRKAFAHGGIETWPCRQSPVGPGAAEFLVEEACRLLRRLRR